MSKFPRIGVMGGRLSPPTRDRIQAFPQETWAQEFFRAKEINLNLIEFVFDEFYPEQNPLLTDSGLKEIKKCIRATNVLIQSVCADYFMVYPLHAKEEKVRAESFSILEKLIIQCADIEVQDIVLPCVDNASLHSSEEENFLCRSLEKIHPLLEEKKIRVALESDYPPEKLKNFLTSLGLKQIRVNYDSGNSASLGFQPAEELAAYGSFVSSVHIKDRLLGGTTVPLGTGNTDFKNLFQSLRSCHYAGSFIIQAAREKGKEPDVVSRQLTFVQNLIQDYFLS